MNRRRLLLFLLILALLLIGTRAAVAQSSEALWFVSYWDNVDQEGTPLYTTSEGVIDHDWGSGSPHALIDKDKWSGRWTTYVDFEPGTYRFIVTSDDGVRVYLGDKHIVLDWNKHPVRTHEVVVSLSGGRYPIAIDYFEDVGHAQLKVGWERTGAPVAGSGYVTVISSGAVIPAPEGDWLAAYWNNTRLSGAPVLQRTERAVNNNWGMDAPAPGVNRDNWSARWVASLNFAQGNYRFVATTDDGMRVWVDGVLIIDSWYDTPARTIYTSRFMEAGYHHVRVEYYDNAGHAVARLSWQPEPLTISEWRGEYYNNTSLGGSPVLVRNDAAIDFNWGRGAPAPSVNADRFSARWTRTLDLVPGRYRFTATCDDGVRLWVGNNLLIDHWYEHASETHSAEVDWPGGKLPVRMEYYEETGLAESRLSWQRLGAAPDTGGQPVAAVNTAWLNVRVGPGANYERITSLPRGTYVTMLARNSTSTWVWVRLDSGQQGWMYAPYLTTDYNVPSLPPYETGVPEEGGNGLPTAIVTRAQYLNLRSGPGVGYAIIGQLRGGDVVELAGHRNQDATWVSVIAPNGQQGWVNAYFLESDFPFESLPVGG